MIPHLRSASGASRLSIGAALTALVTLATVVLLVVVAGSAQAAPGAVTLGTADAFAVLGGSAVTNTGPTDIEDGDLGVSPGTAVTGFPPGKVDGTLQVNNAVALQAQADTTTAYNDLAGRPCDTVLTGKNLGGLTLTAGIYCFASSAQLTGTLTLNAQGKPNAVFIFQIGSTLTTASAARVRMLNGGTSCQVFWQVGSSATLGTRTTFVGSIVALTAITATTAATVDGRLLARNAAVTLDTNEITRPDCEPTTTTTTTTSTSPTSTTTTTPTGTTTTTPTGTTTTTPTGTTTTTPTGTTTTTGTTTPTNTTTTTGTTTSSTATSTSATTTSSSTSTTSRNGRGDNEGDDRRRDNNRNGRNGDDDRSGRGQGSDSGDSDSGDSDSGDSGSGDSDNASGHDSGEGSTDTSGSSSTADENGDAAGFGQVRRVPVGSVDTGDGSTL